MTHKYETLQSVYDAAKAHLLSMKKPSKGEGEESEICLYRSADGNKCVAGYFIPDDVYEPKMENVSALTLFSYHYNVVLMANFHTDIRAQIPAFLRNLQVVHDKLSNWSEDGLNEYGKENLSNVARSYGLKS